MEIIDWRERPYINQQDMELFTAKDPETAKMYGKRVRAAQIANVDYKTRYFKFGGERKMSPPPSCGRIFLGYIVVRRLGTPDEYETWMPDHVFDEIYVKVDDVA